MSNAVFPSWLGHLCQEFKIPWGHVSTGCVYDGLTSDLCSLTSGHVGWKETDPPNFRFGRRCSFYSGSKVLGEQLIASFPCYIWRIRMPFDEGNHPKNYITKMISYARLYENTNSFSHRGEAVSACLSLWLKAAQTPLGTPRWPPRRWQPAIRRTAPRSSGPPGWRSGRWRG